MEFVFELLLVIIIIWIYATYSSANSNLVSKKCLAACQMTKEKKIRESLTLMSKLIDMLCYNLDLAEIFQVKVGKQNNIIGKTIYLILWDENRNMKFDDNTIAFNLIHIFTHHLTESSKHNKIYKAKNNELLKIATRLKFYHPEIPLEPGYPKNICYTFET